MENSTEGWVIAIALLGAVTGTLSLLWAVGWSIYRYRKQRPRIRVTATFAYIHSASGTEGPFINLNAANVGPVPITVNGMGFWMKSGDRPVLHCIPVTVGSLPRRLEPNTSHDERIIMAVLFEGMQQRNEDPSFLKYAWFRDATERYHKERLTRIFRKGMWDNFKDYRQSHRSDKLS